MTLVIEVLSHLSPMVSASMSCTQDLPGNGDWQKRSTAWDMGPRFPFVSDPVNYTLGPDLRGTDW